MFKLAYKQIPMISEIKSEIEKIEIDSRLYDLNNFNSRSDAIDFIEFHIIDRIEGLVHKTGLNDELNNLKIHANSLKEKLENIDIKMFDCLQQQINGGKIKPLVLRKIIKTFLQTSPYGISPSDEMDYDNLDIFFNRLLSGNVRNAIRELEPEMVFYQKTPVRIIIELSKKINRRDVFFDIGSGLGQVVILVNIISYAKATGIEFEPSYCNYANEVVRKFELFNVEFINGDARSIDYTKGTVFYLYTPFIGKMMQDVLALLQKVALNKVIKIFTYGPCSMEIAHLNWVKCINGNPGNIRVLNEFNSLL